MDLDSNFTPEVLIEKVRNYEYIKRFQLPYNESLVCAFKCTLKKPTAKLGKLYIFNRYICFWPQVGKSHYESWKFEDISGIISDQKVLKIIFIKNDKAKISGIENEKYIQIVCQHWNNYCCQTNRSILSSESEFDSFDFEDSNENSLEVSESSTEVTTSIRQLPVSLFTQQSQATKSPTSSQTSPVPHISPTKDQKEEKMKSVFRERTSISSLSSKDVRETKSSKEKKLRNSLQIDIMSSTPSSGTQSPFSPITQVTQLTQQNAPTEVQQTPSPQPQKVTYEGFLTSTEFQLGGETDLDCSVKDFYEKFIKNESKQTYIDILAEKEITNINVGDWTPDEKHGNIRNEEFIVPLKGVPFGPSTARTVGTAIHYFDGETLYFCTTNQTPDVPYGDSFKMEFKRTITPKGDKQCHYLEEFQVVFLKKVMLKGTIEGQGVSNAKKDAETMMKKYAERISGKVSGKDDQLLPDDTPEPKFFKNSKMKVLLESTISMSHTEFFKLFFDDESKEMQMKLYEAKNATNIEIGKWKSSQNASNRMITTIQPVTTTSGKITTRTQTQQFHQLKQNSFVLGSIYNQLDVQDYYTIESRLVVKSISQSESIITYYAHIVMKKKGEEKEKDLLFKFEKECRDQIDLFEELHEEQKVIESTKNTTLIKRVSNKVVKLSFKEQMMAVQNVLLFLIFLALFAILIKL